MSDIPPELLEDKPPVVNRRSLWAEVWSEFWWVLVLLVLCLWFLPFSSQAATFDTSQVFCETFAQDADNGRYYIVSDPAWEPSCANWVTLRSDKFLTLVEAYEGGSSASPQFTADEVAALKYQAANPSPFNLSLAGGALVGSSVLAVWALASVFKTLALQLQGHFSPSED